MTLNEMGSIHFTLSNEALLSVTHDKMTSVTFWNFSHVYCKRKPNMWHCLKYMTRATFK